MLELLHRQRQEMQAQQLSQYSYTQSSPSGSSTLPPYSSLEPS